jgi:WD40 repeat protein
MSWSVVRFALLLLACGTAAAPQSKAPMLVTQTAHPATIICVAFNAGGTLMASGDEAGLVKIWDFKSRRQVRTLFAGTGPVTSLAFDPVSGALATVAGFEDGVELWDLESGAKRKLDGVRPAYGSLAFSPNGSWLIHGGWAGISAWNLKKSVRILVDSHPVSAVAFTHDGKYLFTGDDDGVLREWPVPGTGESSWSASSRMSKRDGEIYSIAASPDDEYLAIGGWTVELWGRAKLQYERSFGKKKISSRRPAVFSPDGAFLAAPGDPENGPVHPLEDDRPVFENSHLMLWRIDGSEYAALAANGEPMAAIAFHPTEPVIAGGANDGPVRLWDFHQRSEIESQTSVVHSVSAVLFLKQKNFLLVAAGDETVLWDMNRGNLTRQFTGHRDLVTSVAVSADGRLLATGSKDATVRLWNLAKDEPPTEIKSAGPVYALAFSPIGRILAVGGEYADIRRVSGYITLLSPGFSAAPRTWAAHSGAVKSLAFSANGRRLLSGGQSMSWNGKFPPGDSTIRMWDVATAHPDPSFSQTDHNASVAAVAFVPDGSGVVVGRAAYDPSSLAKRSLTIDQIETKELNPDTGSAVKETVTREPAPEESRSDLVLLSVTGQNLHSDPFSGAVSSIAIQPGGRRIATGAMLDSAIPIWDTATGKIVSKLPGNGSTVNGVAFNRNGTLLASGTVDGVVSVWNISRKEELARLLRLGKGNWVVVRPDGSFDTNDLDQIEGLQWIFPDAPLQPLPPEVFMRDYFEPRLLARASAGEVFGKKGPV